LKSLADANNKKARGGTRARAKAETEHFHHCFSLILHKGYTKSIYGNVSVTARPNKHYWTVFYLPVVIDNKEL
jgi:hypothetical protein